MYSFVHSLIPPGAYAWLRLPSKSPGADGFVEANARILYNGTAEDLENTVFPPGSSVPSSALNPTMAASYYFLLGVEVEKQEYGHVWASLRWIALASPTPADSYMITQTISARDTLWPRTVGDYTVYVPGNIIGKTGHIDPGSGKHWNVRLTDYIYGTSIRGITLSDYDSPVAPPPPPSGAPTSLHSSTWISNMSGWAAAGGATYNAPEGWVLRSFESAYSIRLTGTNQVMSAWTAVYEWSPDYSP